MLQSIVPFMTRKIFIPSGFRTAVTQMRVTRILVAAVVIFVFSQFVIFAAEPQGSARIFTPLRTPEDWTVEDWISHDACKTDPLQCTTDRKRWAHRARSDPCVELRNKEVAFVGDSYVRHAYIAFLSWLNNNYKDASLSSEHDANCEYELQYSEKECRKQIVGQSTVCDGHTNVTLVYGHAPWITSKVLAKYDMIVWSIGRHPFDGDYTHRVGVNDAHELYYRVFEPYCRSRNATELCDKVVWLDTHARVKSNHADEAYKEELKFHIETPTWIYRGCNIQRIASVWDATSSLLSFDHASAKNLSFDGVHYGATVNLLKARAVYDAWAKPLLCQI